LRALGFGDNAAGFIIGGTINARFGWRAALVSIGVFGVIVAMLVRLTVREPARGRDDAGIVPRAPEPVGTTLQYLWGLRSYRHLVLASCIFTLGAMGSGIWIPSFFIRVHGMPPAQVAVWLACIYGGGGLLGAFLGGLAADRFVRRTSDVRWQAWVPALCVITILPFSFFVYLWSNPITALLVHTATTFLMHTWMGPCYATVQNLAGPRNRAMAAAINLLVVNVLAIGLGPLVVGMASDFFRERFANGSLRYSLLVLVVLTYTWAALHFLLASRTLRADLRTARSRESM
jgi:predicted MFS family arabinose efflux permease